MPNIAVMGKVTGSDTCTGRCSAHNGNPVRTGIITTGSGRHTVDGQQVARQDDIVTATCGHTGIIQGGSGRHSSDGKNIARVGDSFSGTFTGTITLGLDRTNVA